MISVVCFLVYVGGYVAVQEFLLMRLYKVSVNRRKCAVIVFISSLVFLIAEYYLGNWASHRMDELSLLLYNICHMIYTFVTLTIIGVYAEGFLPRNFIKIFLYYDVLTTLLYGIVIRRITSSLFEPDQLVYSLFQVESSYQYPIIFEYIIQILLVIVITSFINDYVDIFIKKIPDKICVVILGMAFITYIFKITVIVTSFRSIGRIEELHFGVSIESLASYMIFLVILVGAIGFMILTLASNQKKYRRMMSLEMAMQQEYYKTVAKISRTVRELKHDLANHVTVISNQGSNEQLYGGVSGYKQQLIDICGDIGDNIEKQLEWRRIRSMTLSDREKYEIYRCVLYICEHYRAKIDSPLLSVSGDYIGDRGRECTEIKAEIPGGYLKKFLIRGSYQYRLLSLIIGMNEGFVKLEKKRERDIISLMIQV
ncbi:MAG: hypothetical protein UIL73_02730 [Anaerovoracaceae bacterium]|nr:hypothetical protein [Anaerovoracaceae bacterium]